MSWINPIVTIVDEALENYSELRSEVLALDFRNSVGPDGVVYPMIAELSPEVKQAFLGAIERQMGPIRAQHIFARAMPKGLKVPNRIHTDWGYGQASAILYLTSHPLAGTQFWNHRELGQGTLNPPEGLTTKKTPLWTRGVFVPAEHNRLLIHNANFFHSAEPHAGYGTEPESYRLVLTCFFDVGAAHAAP